MIKNLDEENRILCLDFINNCIERNKIPQDLLHSNITLLFKKGDKEDPNNYRSISLSSCLGKLIEKYYTRKIIKFCLKKNILSPNQFGFRPNHSTVDAIMSLKLIVEYYTANQKPIYAALLDFKKAFDSTKITL